VSTRRSLVSFADMLEAVVFLKDLQSRGLVLEVSRGVWLRAPALSHFTSTTPGFIWRYLLLILNIHDVPKK